MNKRLQKNELRKQLKQARKKLDIEFVSKNCIQKLKETEEYKTAKNIMIFYPLEYEINLLPLMNDLSKNFYLPKINGNELLCCEYRNGDTLCESCYKTQEPITEASSKSKIDLVIVPALACDKTNCRLGYGGGFYDRFLKDYKGKTISCISKEFLLDTIYPEEFDIKIDRIITG